MKPNLLAYYRQEPSKLDSDLKRSGFIWGLMCFAGFIGFLAAILIHVITIWVSAAVAGQGAARDYPVNLNLLMATFAFLVCVWGAGLMFASMQQLWMVRALLEEQGVVGSKRPNTFVITLLGEAAGAVVGGLIAVFFMVVLQLILSH